MYGVRCGSYANHADDDDASAIRALLIESLGSAAECETRLGSTGIPIVFHSARFCHRESREEVDASGLRSWTRALPHDWTLREQVDSVSSAHVIASIASPVCGLPARLPLLHVERTHAGRVPRARRGAQGCGRACCDGRDNFLHRRIYQLLGR